MKQNIIRELYFLLLFVAKSDAFSLLSSALSPFYQLSYFVEIVEEALLICI